MGNKKRKSEILEENPKKSKKNKKNKEVHDSSDENDEETGKDVIDQSLNLKESLEKEARRQKKIVNHEKNLEIQKNQNENIEIEKNVEYLENWKNNKESWKFEKRRQISIQKSVLDPLKVSEITFPIALEYLTGSKGNANKFLIKLCEDAINEMEVNPIDDNKEKYQRARELLQILQ